MNNADQLLNWGFNPTGTALGGEGSPSMPTDVSLGLGDPMAEAQAVLANFTAQTARRYGDVSDVKGGIWDPRGKNALSSEVADYKTTDLMRPDEIAVQLNKSDDQLGGGDPVLAPYIPDSTGFAEALYNQDIGFSPEGAATLADSLKVYDPKILEGIYLPRPVEPKVTNEMGLTTTHGGLPNEFYDPTGGLKQGMPEAITRVVSQSAEYQHVDENGVVDKYAPGTSPYDAVRKGILPMPSKPAVTPAQARAFSSIATKIANVRISDSSPNAGASSLSSSGAPVPAGEGKTDTAVNDGVVFGSSYGDSGTPVPEDVPGEKKCNKLWWLLAIPVVGGIVYAATRKKGKRGRK